MSAGGEIAVARDGPASDFSALLEWRNQITAELGTTNVTFPRLGPAARLVS
jgi:hypothetical protein